MKARILMVFLLGLWPAVSGAFPQGERTYKAVQGLQTQEKVVAAVINEAAAKFNFMIRGIARSRLRASNPVFGAITVSYDGAALTLSANGDALRLTGTNGGRIPWETPDGRKIEVEQFIQPQLAKRVYYNKDGHREVVYNISEDLKALTLNVTLHSKYLKTPVQYQLQYSTEE